MHIIDDGIHNCKSCSDFPCTSQPEIAGNNICKTCPIPSRCCKEPFLVLLPCEQKHLQHNNGLIKYKSDGWCTYYNYNNGCSIHKKRPIACRIASCRFIREGKVPEISLNSN